MKNGVLTYKEKQRYRSKGYVIHTCWKCGSVFAGGKKGTYLPAKKVYRHICHRCLRRMGLE